MKYRLAQIMVIVGNWFLNHASALSVDAYEENFDGTRPFGKKK